MAPTSSTLPMRVTRTARGTHVVHVRGFSRLQEQHCGFGGFVNSPPFAVAGLDWAIRYYPGSSSSDDDDGGNVGLFVELLTDGAVAWAYVRLLLLDQTTGLAYTVFSDSNENPTLFDADSWSCTWGTYDVAARSVLRDSGFVRGDCLKIECVVDVVCRDRIAFADPPTRKLAPLHVDDAELLGSEESADLDIHVGAGEPFTAHTSVLNAYASRVLKEKNLGKRPWTDLRLCPGIPGHTLHFWQKF